MNEYQKHKYIHIKYERTLKGWIARNYSNMKVKSKKRNHSMPHFTKEEFKQWIKKQPRLKELFHNWKASNYETNLYPSINRLDDYKGYTFNNMELITWRENNRKGNFSPKKIIRCSIETKKYWKKYRADKILNKGFGVEE